VAFFAFLAIFPAIIAAITLYGLIADPADVARQIESLSGMLPKETQPLIADQLNSVVQSSGGALGFSRIISLLAAIWSASSGTGNLIQAVNLASTRRRAAASRCRAPRWPSRSARSSCRSR
jgi:membrane protein